ncbi:hypothetical protein PG995_006682 [Apiospora arundinis]
MWPSSQKRHHVQMWYGQRRGPSGVRPPYSSPPQGSIEETPATFASQELICRTQDADPAVPDHTIPITLANMSIARGSTADTITLEGQILSELGLDQYLSSSLYNGYVYMETPHGADRRPVAIVFRNYLYNNKLAPGVETLRCEVAEAVKEGTFQDWQSPEEFVQLVVSTQVLDAIEKSRKNKDKTKALKVAESGNTNITKSFLPEGDSGTVNSGNLTEEGHEQGHEQKSEGFSELKMEDRKRLRSPSVRKGLRNPVR